jgi:hypothetical protein
MLKILFFSLFILIHPVHVSMTGVEYSSEKNSFDVSIKMDYNDFITDYRYTINDDQVFDSFGKIDTTVILVNKYLDKKVQIYADDKQLKGKLVKIEFVDGELQMGLIFKNNKNSKNFRVKNLILANVYNDQANLLIFRYDEFEEGVKLTPYKNEHNFYLN